MKNSSIDLSQLSQGVAKLLSQAMQDLFPGLQLVEDWVENAQFCARFCHFESLSKIDLQLIENRMIAIMQEGFQPVLMEMIPSNAAELFAHHKQKILEKEVRESQAPSVNVVRFSAYYDLLKESVPKRPLQKIHFKLTHFESKELAKSHEITLFGLAAPDAGQLKKQFKQFKNERSHLSLEEAQELFLKGSKGYVFLPKGEALLQRLKNFLSNKFQENGFEMLSYSGRTESLQTVLVDNRLLSSKVKYFIWKNEPVIEKNPLRKGLCSLNSGRGDQWLVGSTEEQIDKECISCLNFYVQMIKILGFSCRARCQGMACTRLLEEIKKYVMDIEMDQGARSLKKAFEVHLDVLNESGKVVFSPFIKVERVSIENKKNPVITGTFCASIEKLMALLLEQNSEMGSLEEKLAKKMLANEIEAEYSVAR